MRVDDEMRANVTTTTRPLKPAKPINQVHRKDRAVDDDAWITAMLGRAAVGTLATVSDGQPFINSNLFVYDEGEGVIYMHTARVGRTRANYRGGRAGLLLLLRDGPPAAR